MRKHNINFCNQIAEAHKGKCLSKIYKAAHHKLLWECEKGHQWKASLGSVLYQKSWCPHCHHPYNLEMIQKLAISKGGKCLSKKYKTVHHKLLWECEKGHQWKASLSNVVHLKTWCKSCLYHDLEDAKKIAISKGGKCLSKKYKNAQQELLWECEKGHQWKAPLRNILYHNSWCPECRPKKTYTYKRHNIETAREIAFTKKGKCLSTQYDPKQKLLWECEKGHQWKASLYAIIDKTWCPICNGKRKLNGILEANNIAAQHLGKCLSKNYINISGKLLWECEKGHQWMAPLLDVKRGTWCAKCRKVKKLDLDTIQNDAKKRKGRCLSDKYINKSSPLIWECEKGHRWKAPLNDIRKGHWCPYCNRGVVTIEELKKFAKKKGGECLSDSYSYYKKLLWQCKYGHQWWSRATQINNSNHWCPICGRLRAARKMRRSFILYHWKTNEELVCVGTYEKKTVEYFNRNKIDFLWQSKTFLMPSKKSYRPDAFLIDEDKWIEIKGYIRKDFLNKWKWFHFTYPNSELWDSNVLKEKRILK